MKFIHFYVSGGHLKNVLKTTHLQCHTDLYRKSSLTSHFIVQKIKFTCLRTLETSIGTITIFTSRSGSGSVRCTDSITGQRVSVVLAERLQPGVVALPTLRAPSDWLSSPSNGPSCCLSSDADGAYGTLSVLQHVHLIFLYTVLSCDRLFRCNGVRNGVRHQK